MLHYLHYLHVFETIMFEIIFDVFKLTDHVNEWYKSVAQI